MILALPIFFSIALAAQWGYRSVDKSHGDGQATLLALFLGAVTFLVLAYVIAKLAEIFAALVSSKSYTPSCQTKTEPVRCININPTSNLYTFRFANDQYAKAFSEANRS